jgi:hypothetical protein
MTALTRADRDAMRWVARQTPASSRFVVITGRSPWAVDKVGEWFPALTGRVSLGTVQGREWLPDFAKRVKENDQELQARCRQADGGCLREWASATGRPFTHVFVSKSTLPPELCCERLASALRNDASYRVVYDGPGALIAARR